MESNAAWGEIAEYDSELAEAWDSYSALPDPGDNEALDGFIARKNLDLPALMKLGARLSDHTTIAFPFPGGIKFRDLITDRRWNYFGSEFHKLKLIPAHSEPTDVVLVAEGETDAARLTMLYDLDVAILPAGARYFTSTFAEQLAGYDRVLIALDDDASGNAGAAKITVLLPHAERFLAPGETGSDWSDAQEAPSLPDPPIVLPMLVAAERLLDLEVPEIASWFEHDLLPIGGLLILHGWAKSFKTFIALDMLSALSQGQDWSLFEPREEPCKVAVVQFELTWPYYRDRVAKLAAVAREPELFNTNFHTYSPLARPQFNAGNTVQEDRLLSEMVNAEIQVMLLDPIRRATGASDMNDEAETRRLLGFFERLNNEGITVIGVHHDNKTYGKSGGGDPLGMTGSGSFAGDPDTIVSIQLPKGDLFTESKRRNLYFTLRNSPMILPRSMEIQDDGSILYSNSPINSEDNQEDDSLTPSI